MEALVSTKNKMMPIAKCFHAYAKDRKLEQDSAGPHTHPSVPSAAKSSSERVKLGRLLLYPPRSSYVTFRHEQLEARAVQPASPTPALFKLIDKS